MRVLGYIAAVGLLVANHCGDMPRDNPLDPKNPRSQRQRVVLAEAFVSDDPSALYCPQALDALAQLQAEVGTASLLVAEYHLSNPGKWVDSYALAEARLRYEELASEGLGIPDVFFSGSAGRVQGAHSVSTAYERYRRQFDNCSATPSLFTIEAQARRGTQDKEIQVSLARLGSTPAEGVMVRALILQDAGVDRHHNVVKALLPGQHIAVLQPGEVVQATFRVSGNVLNGDKNWLLVFVESRDERARVVEQVTAVGL
ncbi:MAG: hypothetical protein ONB30_09375 [candidate division KSB1 bacterium]|nr:hypothetical protein [candidate division KSB1 bacterium]